VVRKIATGARHPALTIHDSVLTPPEFVEAVAELLRVEFQERFGFAPQLKVKDYRQDPLGAT